MVFGPDRIKHGRLAAILILRKMSTCSNHSDFVCSRAVFRDESNGAIEILISQIDDFMAEIATNSVLHAYWVLNVTTRECLDRLA